MIKILWSCRERKKRTLVRTLNRRFLVWRQVRAEAKKLESESESYMMLIKLSLATDRELMSALELVAVYIDYKPSTATVAGNQCKSANAILLRKPATSRCPKRKERRALHPKTVITKSWEKVTKYLSLILKGQGIKVHRYIGLQQWS